MRFALAVRMSYPRPVLAGATYLITRRTTQRQFLLKPSALTNQIFLYCLAVAAQRTGVLLHAVCVLSNHYHLVASDPFGRIPEFYGWLHEFVAKALNASYGRWENVWASSETSRVRLVDSAAVLDKLVYTLANPVEAALVSHGSQWPGVRLFRPGRIRIDRPSGFFRENGPTPPVATLEIVAPPIETGERDVLSVIEQAVAAREAELRVLIRGQGRSFLGRRAALAQRITASPSSRGPRRRLSPRVAGRNKWARIEALQRCKAFIARYRDAWRRWCAGTRDVAFPQGTYLMARRFDVAIAET